MDAPIDERGDMMLTAHQSTRARLEVNARVYFWPPETADTAHCSSLDPIVPPSSGGTMGTPRNPGPRGDGSGDASSEAPPAPQPNGEDAERLVTFPCTDARVAWCGALGVSLSVASTVLAPLGVTEPGPPPPPPVDNAMIFPLPFMLGAS
jgi:hypothetical protein